MRWHRFPYAKGWWTSTSGHCEHFVVYTLDEGKKITSEEQVDSLEGCGCKSDIAGVLSRMGVTHMVAGGMGEGAVRALHGHGIDVIRGASGSTKEAVERLGAGTLVAYLANLRHYLFLASHEGRRIGEGPVGLSVIPEKIGHRSDTDDWQRDGRARSGSGDAGGTGRHEAAHSRD